MREILFRGKRTDNGEWVCGGSVITFLDDVAKSMYMPMYDDKCTALHDNITDNIVGLENREFYKVYPETVGQYIGMKDKNGEMIYEGDIVIGLMGYVGNPNIPICKIKFLVEYKNACYQNLYCSDYYKFEIIGNIYDNPELLKNGEQM